MPARQYSTESIVVFSSKLNAPDSTAAIRSGMPIRASAKLYDGKDSYLRLFLDFCSGSSTFITWSFAICLHGNFVEFEVLCRYPLVFCGESGVLED